MNIWQRILKWSGWRFDVNVELPDKCVICVAPHTSNWDFLLGICAYYSIGRRANFLMKSSWFFFPLGLLLKKMGGIPVKRSGPHGSVTESVVEKFKTSAYVNLAVTPEGTRSRAEKWRTGFLYIAYGADVPLLLAVLDYTHKTMTIDKVYDVTGDIEKDMAGIREYYSRFAHAALYPDKFAP